VQLLAAIVVRADRPSQEPIHLFIARHAGFGAEIADLIRRMLVLVAQDKGFRRLSEAMATATELTGQPVELIVPVAFLGAKLGFPDDPLALPTIGRAVGWLAHALEQSRRQPLVRPRAIYVGQLPDELTD
jgi:citrate synthase